MVHAKVKRVRIVKRIKTNLDHERTLREAASRIRLIMLNTDAVGDRETYWALQDALSKIEAVLNPTNYTLLKEAQ